jgi:hypothetical protein
MGYPDPRGPLVALPEPARRVWGDANYRRRLFEEVFLGAGTEADRTKAVQALSDAARLGLAALGLPVQAAREVDVVDDEPRWLGDKTRDCALHFSRDRLASLVLGNPSDQHDVFCTWLHEHCHARLRFAGRLAAWWEGLWIGYEEGLAEGVCRWAASHAAGALPDADLEAAWVTTRPYDWYVLVYRTIAHALGVPTPALLRDLWTCRPLGIRGRFGAVVCAHHQARHGRPARWWLGLQVRLTADPMMHRRHLGARISEQWQAQHLAATWEQMLLP